MPELVCPVGLLFLLAFGFWGAVCITNISHGAAMRASRGLWSSVAVLSALMLAFQITAQFAYFGSSAWAETVEKLLQLLGFRRAQDPWQLLAVCSPA